MQIRYSIVLVMLFMILALSRGFVLQNFGELSPFSVLHALAEGDGGGGDGGGGDGGGGDGGGGDGGGGDGGGDADTGAPVTATEVPLPRQSSAVWTLLPPTTILPQRTRRVSRVPTPPASLPFLLLLSLVGRVWRLRGDSRATLYRST